MEPPDPNVKFADSAQFVEVMSWAAFTDQIPSEMVSRMVEYWEKEMDDAEREMGA